MAVTTDGILLRALLDPEGIKRLTDAWQRLRDQEVISSAVVADAKDQQQLALEQKTAAEQAIAELAKTRETIIRGEAELARREQDLEKKQAQLVIAERVARKSQAEAEALKRRLEKEHKARIEEFDKSEACRNAEHATAIASLKEDAARRIDEAFAKAV